MGDSSKAQANLIQYAMTILFGVIVIVSLTFLVYSFYENYREAEITRSLKTLAMQTSDGIVKIYQNYRNVGSEPTNESTIVLYEGELDLPQRVSNINYEIMLVSSNPSWSTIEEFTINGESVTPTFKTSGAKIIAQTTQKPFVTIEQDVPNIDIDIQGRSANGQDTQIVYYRFNTNGTIYDKIVLGNPEILIEISSLD
jgi:hypothetical protein